MIHKWHIENFKSVSKADLEFTPLTIFVGANSSGKSTVIQSILLIAQTLQSSIEDKHLVLNGDIFKFGNIEDIINNNSKDSDLVFKFRIAPIELQSFLKSIFGSYMFRDSLNRGVKYIDVEAIFFKESLSFEIKNNPQKLVVKEANFKSVFADETSELISFTKSKEESYKRISSLKISHEISENESRILDYYIEDSSKLKKDNFLYALPDDVKFVGVSLANFLPRRLGYVFSLRENFKDVLLKSLRGEYSTVSMQKISMSSELKNEIKGIYNETLEEYKVINTSTIDLKLIQHKIENFISETSEDVNLLHIRDLSSTSDKFNDLIQSKLKDKTDHIKALIDKDVSDESGFNSIIYPNIAVEFVETFFSGNIKYIGPLRDEPKAIYPLVSSYEPENVGYRGENTAAVLEQYGLKVVDYIPSSFFQDLKDFKNLSPEQEGITKSATLFQAVTDWLNYLCVAVSFDTSDKGKFGHELRISSFDSNFKHDLTHVGVGVSQVLPILVMCLLSTSNSTLIIEQPELHLNPKVQTRLADFLFSMTLLKKQCLVETHSEYFITRLRFLSAIDLANNLHEKVTVYNVTKNEQGNSQYSKVSMNKYGAFNEWPDGFFDESQSMYSKLINIALKKKKNYSNE